MTAKFRDNPTFANFANEVKPTINASEGIRFSGHKNSVIW
jgi:hypothetical protein